MKIDDDFKSRITLARQAIGLTQGDLAEKVGVVRRQIAAYEAGDSKPREKVLNNLSAALGTTTEWLSSGIGISPDLTSVRRTVTLKEIPLFNIDDVHNLGAFIINGMVASRVSNFIVAPHLAPDDAFAVRITGNSMASLDGISFPHESIVTFTPKSIAKNNDFILCKFGNMLVFKQLIIDQGRQYLRSLNPDYPMWETDQDILIYGVAIHSQFYLTENKEYTPSIFTKPQSYKNDAITPIEQRLDKIESMLEQLLKNK